MNILLAMAVLGALGALCGLILAVLDRLSAPTEDPRERRLKAALPGLDCGACGHKTCGEYARSVMAQSAPIGACPVGGESSAGRMARIMKTECPPVPRGQAAVIQGTPGGKSRRYYEKRGFATCAAAHEAEKDEKGCIGLLDCAGVCPFEAIGQENGRVRVEPEKCRGCTLCLERCPRGLIRMEPRPETEAAPAEGEETEGKNE